MGTFVTARLVELSRQAPMHDGPEGRAFQTAMGQAQDDETALLRVAALARSHVHAPDDALDVIGEAYQRPRAPRETNNATAYRARLGDAFGYWESAPRISGLGAWHRPYDLGGVVTVYSDHDTVWDDGLWSSRVFFIWDAVTDIGIDLEADGDWDDPDPGTYDDGGLWDLFYDAADPYTGPSFGVADLDWVRREVRRGKGAQAYPVWIGVSLAASDDGGVFWDSLNALGEPGTWDEPGSPTWDDIGADGDYVFLPLGEVWGDEAFYGGGPGLWDGDDSTWRGFVPPDAGGW